MSTNNANLVPRSRGAKKGAPRTLPSNMTSEAIFKAMDLKASASVAFYIPKRERGGDVRLVPGHIRGCSNNAMRVISEIEQFRNKGESRQNEETVKWSAFSAKEKKVYNNRIAELEFIREELNLGIATWAHVTVVIDGAFVENEIDLPAPPEPPATDSAAATIHTPAHGVSNAMAVSADELTASGNEENQDPNAYVGLGSNQELRDKKESEAKHRARHDKKRPLGSFAERIDQQGDSQATTSLVNAFRAVGIACDTTHYPDHTEGQPRSTIVCFAVTQIADSLPQGGRMKTGGSVRTKTKVTIVGRDKESVQWALGEVMKVCKHGESSSTHERIDLFQDTETKMVQTTIDNFFEAKKKARKQPPQKPLTGREVVDEAHLYFASPAGQQDPAVFEIRSRL
jgi:hypothetical protein